MREEFLAFITLNRITGEQIANAILRFLEENDIPVANMHGGTGLDYNILAGMDRTLCGSRVPVCIVGDSAYPLQTLLMKPFINSPSLSVQQVFQLSPLTSSHCCEKRIWMFKGTMEVAAQEE